MRLNDTIAAIATPSGTGGIGILRISGKHAFEIADRLFAAKNGKPLIGRPGYTAAYGKIVKDGEAIDEAVALVFRKPRSYTGEDVVELSAHGGVYVMQRILDAALYAGARLAEAGEFTQRAFLNGRMDLTQAESVMDLIEANGETALRAALAQREGAAFRRIDEIKKSLYDLLSDISAFLDFPEEDVPEIQPEVMISRLVGLQTRMKAFLSSYEAGQVIKNGVETAIVGRPNVGKSTLMNLLTGTERSIVTAVPGTTRDVVEEAVRFAGLMLKLADTAGIRQTEEEAERIGVQRAKRRMEEAQLVLAVFDGSAPLQAEDEEILRQLRGKLSVFILNKADLGLNRETETAISACGPNVKMSAFNGSGADGLDEKIRELAGVWNFDENAGLIANRRQLECALRAKDGIDAALRAAEDGITVDAISTGLEQAADALADLTGERASEEIIGQVFSKFCVGK